MTDLVCCLSTGKGTWMEVAKLISNYEWRNIFLITNDFGKEKFSAAKPVKLVIIDPNKSIDSMKKAIEEALKDKLSGDVAINLTSGSGQEHMALLTALMNLGVGIRFVTATEKEITEI
ncbi:hypothetical protein HZA98_01265 [Candidatus Woesearchaeota archaeon]|nr:hypothetical protein [Candidatus Woesearchaeota archaeon]